MVARIYKPARSAMQSGMGKTHNWVLDFEPEEARQLEPVMGWTGSGDMKGQVKLRFASLEAAIAYAKAHNIPCRVEATHEPVRHGKSYADNFKNGRAMPWTH